MTGTTRLFGASAFSIPCVLEEKEVLVKSIGSLGNPPEREINAGFLDRRRSVRMDEWEFQWFRFREPEDCKAEKSIRLS